MGRCWTGCRQRLRRLGDGRAEAAVLVRRKAGEWHPLFQAIATVAFPLIYAVYLGVAESARDIAIERHKMAVNENVTSAGC